MPTEEHLDPQQMSDKVMGSRLSTSSSCNYGQNLILASQKGCHCILGVFMKYVLSLHYLLCTLGASYIGPIGTLEF